MRKVRHFFSEIKPIRHGNPTLSHPRGRPAKARTAALGRRESGQYEETLDNGRRSFLSAPAPQGMLEGGVPVTVGGHCVGAVGAVGVSGVKSDQDAQVARAGIAALKLPG